jgi:DNA-binding MarR family transcriptional regulator
MSRAIAPSSLDSPLRRFRRSLRALEREVELALSEQTECCGVTSAQCHLLLEIEAGGRASIGELASALALDPSTLSRTVDSLVRAALVSRSDDPSNRRRQLVELLPAGREKVEAINAACDSFYEPIVAGAAALGPIQAASTIEYLARAFRERRSAGGAICGNEPEGKV